MASYSKGKKSREEIISSSKQIFNEYGIQITLAKLAELLDTTLGRITHHFKNKDLLFIAIAEQYENNLVELRKERNYTNLSIESFIKSASDVMDLQYEYRCAVRYIISSLNDGDEMKTHLQKTYSNNRESIRKTIEAIVQAGSVQSRILNEENYEVFLFQFTNLFTNWVINYELYDYDKQYVETKPIYLKGIVSIFLPYLTQKGADEINQNPIFNGSGDPANRD